MRQLSDTMVEFWDEGEHQRDHEGFKKWQRSNRYGYVLNFPANEPVKLHKSGCPHVRDFSDPAVSLTMHRKVCSTDGAELTMHVDRRFERCDTCGGRSHDQLR